MTTDSFVCFLLPFSLFNNAGFLLLFRKKTSNYWRRDTGEVGGERKNTIKYFNWFDWAHLCVCNQCICILFATSRSFILLAMWYKVYIMLSIYYSILITYRHSSVPNLYLKISRSAYRYKINYILSMFRTLKRFVYW